MITSKRRDKKDDTNAETLPPDARALMQAEQWLFDMEPGIAARLLRTWQAAIGDDNGFGTAFYQKLFQSHPEVLGLFPGDMALQQSRLTRTLGEAVELVRTPEKLILLLKAAGVRHHHYHVQQIHFALMQEALIETLTARLGAAFQPQDAVDWRQFFHCMALIMRDGMANATR